MGRPLAAQMPGGLSAALTYSPRGWLTSVSLNDAASTRTITFAHDAVGNVTLMTLPGGGSYSYTYDGNGWLTGATSSDGETLAFTHDNVGNITGRTISNAGGVQFSSTSVFDDLSRLISSVNATGDAINYAYNAAGDLTSITYPGGHTWSNAFDGLGRILSVTDPQTDTEAYTHETSSNVTGFQDGRSLATSFTHNGFGEVLTETSPDRGTTSYTYDNAGRLTSRGDANETVSFAYDAGGRLIARTHPGNAALDMAFTYGSTGALATVTDTHGSIAYTRNGFGDTLSEQRALGGQTYTTSYGHNALGQVTSITYPSGREVAYTRTPLGQVTGIQTRMAGGSWQAVTSNMSWKPFGPLVSYDAGNGLPVTRAVDQNYRLTALRVGAGGAAVLDKTIGYDGAGRVTSITDALTPANTSTYAYTTDGRLAQAIGPWGDLRWAYDGVGNRMMEDLYDGSGALISEADYSYPATINQLRDIRDGAGIVVRDFTHSGDGHLLTDSDYTAAPDYTYEYDQAGRLSAIRENGALAATYGHDAFGRRAARSVAGAGTVHSLFDVSGKPLAEHDGTTGAVLREYAPAGAFSGWI
ncbi:MAG: hypothetical protein AAF829_13435 [Pseudomonadota bacterium]